VDARPGSARADAGVTRRALLIGGGAATVTLLAGGAMAARELPLRAWWNRVSGACGDAGPIPPASGSPTRTGTFRSEVLGADVGYALAVPPGHAIGDPLPVAFLLPGRGGTAADTFGSTRFPDFLAQGIVERGVAPFGLAAVDGGSSYWHARASGEDRMAMLIDEFAPMCADRWRLGEERRSVAGWSMGGYGAILAAELHPVTFDAVAAASPAIYRTFDEVRAAAGDEFDSAQDLARYDVFTRIDALLGVEVRIDCGTADPFYANDRAFVDALPEPPAGTFFKGCHDGDSWRVVAPGQVDFLGKALSGS
jgi:S-formylglutathione hydrolase FrmB